MDDAVHVAALSVVYTIHDTDQFLVLDRYQPGIHLSTSPSC